MHHYDLKNHVILRGALVEVSGTHILFQWIGLKKLYNTTLYVHYLLKYQRGRG